MDNVGVVYGQLACSLLTTSGDSRVGMVVQ